MESPAGIPGETFPANNEDIAEVVPDDTSPANPEETWAAWPEDSAPTSPDDTWADAPERPAENPEDDSAFGEEETSSTVPEEGSTVTATANVGNPTVPAAETETASGWTAKDDKTLMDLKATKTTWKDITKALPGKKGIKERFKQLNSDSGNASATVPAVQDGGGVDNKTAEEAPARVDVEDQDQPSSTAANHEQATRRSVLRFEDGSELSIQEVSLNPFTHNAHDIFS